jgi:hypothetical protein
MKRSPFCRGENRDIRILGSATLCIWSLKQYPGKCLQLPNGGTPPPRPEQFYSCRESRGDLGSFEFLGKQQVDFSFKVSSPQSLSQYKADEDPALATGSLPALLWGMQEPRRSSLVPALPVGTCAVPETWRLSKHECHLCPSSNSMISKDSVRSYTGHNDSLRSSRLLGKVVHFCSLSTGKTEAEGA